LDKRATAISIIEALSWTRRRGLEGMPIIKSGGEIAVYETFNAM